MSLQQFFVIVVGLVLIVGVPAAIIWTIVDHVSGRGRKRQPRGGGGGGHVIGAMLVELDRVVRPSVEHVVEAENQILKREDDQGGE